MVERVKTDVLIIGAGGAAARAAVEAAVSDVRVDLVDKGEFGASGTSSVCLHGLASTFNSGDSHQSFFDDWIVNGGHISNQNLVWEAITKSRKAVEGLEALGMEFVRNTDGTRVLYRGAGHSVARGLTVKAPVTVTVLRAEAERRGVRIHEGVMVTRLLKKDNRVVGAKGITQTGDLFVFHAKAVILAAGGANHIYPNLPPDIAGEKFRTTGDAFYLAFAAGVPLIDMEFAQFRESPPGAARFGGRYINSLGERFMERYDPNALEKAPRCKVVEAVYGEKQAGRGPIIWEVGGITEAESKHPPADRYYGKERLEVNIDFQRLLGGVLINERAETSLFGLFAAGESAGGIHGGNRLQGNGFLETQVFGAIAGKNAAALALRSEWKDIDLTTLHRKETSGAARRGSLDPREIARLVQKTMYDQVGVVRDSQGLRDALDKFKEIRKKLVPRFARDDVFVAFETENLLTTAELVATSALAREETRGTHIRTDFPSADDSQWLKHICIINRDGEMQVSFLPVVMRPEPG